MGEALGTAQTLLGAYGSHCRLRCRLECLRRLLARLPNGRCTEITLDSVFPNTSAARVFRRDIALCIAWCRRYRRVDRERVGAGSYRCNREDEPARMDRFAPIGRKLREQANRSARGGARAPRALTG